MGWDATSAPKSWTSVVRHVPYTSSAGIAPVAPEPADATPRAPTPPPFRRQASPADRCRAAARLGAARRRLVNDRETSISSLTLRSNSGTVASGIVTQTSRNAVTPLYYGAESWMLRTWWKKP